MCRLASTTFQHSPFFSNLESKIALYQYRYRKNGKRLSELFCPCQKILNKAKCKLWPDETPKLISYSTTSKTNLQTHFERKHKDEVKNMQLAKSEKKISSDVQHSTTDDVVDFIIEPLSLTGKENHFVNLCLVLSHSGNLSAERQCVPRYWRKGNLSSLI